MTGKGSEHYEKIPIDLCIDNGAFNVVIRRGVFDEVCRTMEVSPEDVEAAWGILIDFKKSVLAGKADGLEPENSDAVDAIYNELITFGPLEDIKVDDVKKFVQEV